MPQMINPLLICGGNSQPGKLPTRFGTMLYPDKEPSLLLPSVLSIIVGHTTLGILVHGYLGQEKRALWDTYLLTPPAQSVQTLAWYFVRHTLIDYYNADHLADSRILEQVIQRLSTDDPLHNKLVKAIYIKTGTEILLPHIVNNDDLRQGGKQQYFDALFSKPKFISLVEDLCSMFGRETPVKAHSLIFSESLEKKTALSQCLYTLQRTVGNKDEILLGTVIEQIKDWDWFQYFNASHAIRNENELSISNVQREWMENYTRNLLTEIDTVEIRKKFYDEHRVNQCLQLALTTAVRLNMSFPLEVLHTFVLIPSFLFGESNPTVFPEYLLDHIPEAEMSKLVLHNLQYEEP